MQTLWMRRSITLLTCASLLLSGCASYRVVSLPSEATQAPAVHTGDQVQVTTRDGQTRAFRVTALEPDALVGKDVRVLFADISVLEVKRVDAGRSGIVAGIAIGVALIAALLWAFDELHASPDY